ncbi:MAG: single-stranded DNA-binding protein [Rikenellaceae bacterium]
MSNYVKLRGFVASEPNVKATELGYVVSLRLATIERLLNRKTGREREHTEWHNVSAFGDVAKMIDERVEVGMALEVIGSLRTREWVDKSGVVRKTTSVSTSEITILESIEGCEIPQAISELMVKLQPPKSTTPPPQYEVKAPAADPDELPF